MRGRIVFVALAILAVTQVYGHSWLDCSNWKFSNTAAYTNAAAQRFADQDGTCQGWARRFPIGQKQFGGMDSVQFFRHYVQPAGSSVACRWTDGSRNSEGSNESPGYPRSLSYTPNKDPYGQYTYGSMAQVKAGDTMCWRWPAKNHMAHVDVATNMVHVNFDDVPNRPQGTELTWSQLRQRRVASLRFANCPVPGVPSSGDSSGVGSDFRPCGGCFTVPARAPGVYTVQWDWPFKTGDSETYTSCADIEVVAGGTTGGGTSGGGSSGGGSGGTGTGTTNTNCVVSAWSAFGTCTANCGGGTQTRTRTVTTQPSGTGTACPATSESQTCNTATCSGSVGQRVVFDDTLHDFSDWSWATQYSLSASSPVYAGSASISWRPRSWDAVFIHFNIAGANLANYRAISFYINGGSAGGQNIRLVMAKSAAMSMPVLTWTVPRASIKRNAWTKVSLTFSTIGFSSGAFDGIWFQANSGGTQSTVYIDEVYLTYTTSATARLDTEGQDPCMNVACGPGAYCVGGSCTCKESGYGLDDNGACTIAPTITSAVLQTPAGAVVTALDGAEYLYALTWNSTGSIDAVSIVLEEASSSSSTPSLHPIAMRIPNSGSFNWDVPEELEPGTYYLRVVFSPTQYARTAAFTKTATPTETCRLPDCNSHGVCDSDSSYVCSCGYGWGGENCTVEPVGVERFRSSIDVTGGYSAYAADPAAFKTLFRHDIASALGLVIDQIEVVSVSSSDADAAVSFDILLGAMFDESPFVTNTTVSSAITEQLALSTSALNHGVLDYDESSTQQLASASKLSSSGLVILISAIATIVQLINM